MPNTNEKLLALALGLNLTVFCFKSMSVVLNCMTQGEIVLVCCVFVCVCKLLRQSAVILCGFLAQAELTMRK